MKKILCVFFVMGLIFGVSEVCFADHPVLNVLSKSGQYLVFIDGDKSSVGTTPLKLSNVMQGTHLLRALDSTSFQVIYNEIINLKPNEVTTIIVDEKSPNVVDGDMPKTLHQQNVNSNLSPKDTTNQSISDTLHLYGSFASMNFNILSAGVNYTATFDPQYGIGLDYTHWLGGEGSDLAINGGFVYNFLSKVALVGTTLNGSQGISFPYLNIVKNVYKKDFDINIGGGLNYAIYGGGSVTGKIGGQFYFEAAFPAGQQEYIIDIGYLTANGSTTSDTTASSQGIFIRGGYAWYL